MKIAVVGAGPGGLYFAALAKQLNPAHDITIWERNAPDDTFGFGVAFADETLGGSDHHATEFAAATAERFAQRTDIDIHYRGKSFTVGGQGFAAMSRKGLLALLQERVRSRGITVRYTTQAPDADELRATHDLVVAADGANSRTRAQYASVFHPDLDRRHNKYMWLGTDLVFEAFQFYIKHSESETMQVPHHHYTAPFSWRCTRTCGAGPASTPRRTPGSRPAPATSRRSRGCASCSPASWPATSCSLTTRSG
jgi:anthraniloyl-CoA monooxygenase